ncbi:bifunctional metallophosphatase/5'-nucleotidase [Geodermatophilus sp. YIM 151500]|uniref:bifunctional metallophosphatase/5'-nucleotidase n=1 Tax=Geodermatophilus sp. YIM 151500 TaxID=2984531 RepID=UPI0021E4AAB2|nr:bifunctional metallophosphatase/5'-nucleotidase [Geodermatophilus sp. YIM 151500]MCV2488815.1 bifunctional metallophosphatase/5'-nucleotidase [Geodermatophilus sp. YIM 151500]
MRSLRAMSMSLATAAAMGGPVVADALGVALSTTSTDDVAVQLVAMNDFHGRIQATSGDDSKLVEPGPDGQYATPDDTTLLVGGAAHVAATVDRVQEGFWQETAGRPGASFFVGAGDLIGASPFRSTVFKDEPTVEVLDEMGLDLSSVGNHEFDRGTEELRRLSAATDGTWSDDVTACQGVTPDVDGCFGEGAYAFDGAQFPYLAANVVDRATGDPMLPPYQVLQSGSGPRLALIGVTTRTTADRVLPDGIGDVAFIDEAQAVNRWIPEIRDQGIEAIGVLVHEGGDDLTPEPQDPNGCGDLQGPIVDINARIGPAVDLVISAHTNAAYNCLLPSAAGGAPRLVTQAGYYGRLVTDIRLVLDRETGEVDRRATYGATNVPVTRDVVDEDVAAVVDYWGSRAEKAGAAVVGRQTDDLDRAYAGGRVVQDSESTLGNVIADARLAAARSVPALGGADIAFVHPATIGEDLDCTSGLGASEEDGEITRAETYTVQPALHTVDVVEMTGAGIERVLEQQWAIRAGDETFVQLSVPGNVRYTFDPAAPIGERIDPAQVTIDGAPLDLDRVYRVAASSFLLSGADGFGAFLDGRVRGAVPVTGPSANEVLTSYLASGDAVQPPALDRVVSADPARPFDDDGSDDYFPGRC